MNNNMNNNMDNKNTDWFSEIFIAIVILYFAAMGAFLLCL